MIEILLASNNEGKIKEYEDLLKDYPAKLYLLKDLNIVSDPEENGNSYIENALIKARALKNKTNLYILADDSGVEFEALGSHFPGIHTHRYALENGGNKVLNPKLAKEIGGSKATFYCALALITPNKEEYTFLGHVNGKVAKKVEGNNGFGYDPIFIIDGFLHSNAYYSEEIKNKNSHRAKAVMSLISFFKEKNIF